MDILRDISFGIEIESCFHVVDKRFDMGEDEHIKYFYKCMKAKHSHIDWELILDESERSKTYDKWILMPDLSVMCASGDDDDLETFVCISKGVKKSPRLCNKLEFYPIEIITPKLTVGIKRANLTGLEELYYVFNGFLYTDNIVYTTNESQGLHVNISHPKMNMKNFIDIWVHYEPAIIKCLPPYRRKNIIEFSIPLSSQKGNLYDLSTAKYVSVRTEDDYKQPEKRRFEIRIGEGSIDFFQVYFWTVFCLIFLAMTIQKPDQIGNRTLVSLLDFIEDSDTQKMLLERYRKYKDPTDPDINYIPSKKRLLYPPWQTLSEKEQQEIVDMRYTLC